MKKPSSVILRVVFSPSRLIFDSLKKRNPDRGKFHRLWNKIFNRVEMALAGTLIVASIYFPSLKDQLVIALPLLILAWSRINEMAYAFYSDALSHLNKKDPDPLSYPEKARMALKSYLGLIIYFSIIYYFNGHEGAFSSGPADFFDCLYFSTITITSLGYGDMFPEDTLMKTFAMYEALLGLLVVAIAIGTYIGGAGRDAGK